MEVHITQLQHNWVFCTIIWRYLDYFLFNFNYKTINSVTWLQHHLRKLFQSLFKNMKVWVKMVFKSVIINTLRLLVDELICLMWSYLDTRLPFSRQIKPCCCSKCILCHWIHEYTETSQQPDKIKVRFYLKLWQNKIHFKF